MLTTLAKDISMKIKWFERWKSSPAHREALKFLKPKFNDIEFPKWPYKATWWAQVIIFFIYYFLFIQFPSLFKIIYIYYFNNSILLNFISYVAVGYWNRETLWCYCGWYACVHQLTSRWYRSFAIIFYFVEAMRISLWNIAFFREFGVDKRIHKNHNIDK